MMLLQTYYRQNHYKPVYVLRSAVSLFLQIPFFIAAYRFLSGLEYIRGNSFGMIADLGNPDGLLQMGEISVNVLPVIMTAENLISCIIFTKGSPLKAKIQLYAMALFFLMFLYDSPAGIVFYNYRFGSFRRKALQVAIGVLLQMPLLYFMIKRRVKEKE